MNDKLWENEPNIKEFEYKGFKCLIKRHEDLLHLCGYVFVPEDTNTKNLNVHGGITWEGPLSVDGKYCIGFDCGHFDDLIPGFIKYLPEHMRNHRKCLHYWTIDEVEQELKQLVDQF